MEAGASTDPGAGAGSSTEPGAGASSEDAASAAARKRYESLLAVKSKAIKGKGAWYWAHLDPILVVAPAPSTAAAAKLRCSLCSAVFSASNPSRTASEHLKRGSCAQFPPSGAGAPEPRPISALPPPPTTTSTATSSPFLYRRRSSTGKRPLQLPAQSSPRPPPVLSGGKDDLAALAMLEDSVKRLKSPSAPSVSPLGRAAADAAIAALVDWIIESGGTVSVLGHRKLTLFLAQVGLPSVSPRQLVRERISAKYDAVKAETNARIGEAGCFQLATGGWRSAGGGAEYGLVSIIVNMPNGNVLLGEQNVIAGQVTAGYAEEILSAAAAKFSGGVGDRCVGIVADRFRSKVLQSIEDKNPRMVNLYCQVQAFRRLVKDFVKEIPVFRKVSGDCSRLADFVNNRSHVRSIFLKWQVDEYGHSRLLRSLVSGQAGSDDSVHKYFEPEFEMLEDVWSFARPIRMAVLDEDHKLSSAEDPAVREVAEMVQNGQFWSELEAVYSLVRLVKDMAREVEAETPLVGQCLPLWNELRSKVKDWSSKYSFARGLVENVVENGFAKNYHPAWSAAFVLDPVYLSKNATEKYLPPFGFLTPEQEKDVHKLVTRLVPPEDLPIVSVELMKWRTEGLDPSYAQAVQMKQKDPSTGKMRLANPQSRRMVWETCLNDYKCLPKLALRLIFFHATSCSVTPGSKVLRLVRAHGRSETIMKLAFLTSHLKIERRDFSTDEEKDAKLLTNAEDVSFSETRGETSAV